MQTIKVSKTLELPLSPEQVWELLSNTEHLNRTIELPPVSFSPAIQQNGETYRVAYAKKFGISLRWKEYPFEWVENRFHFVVRKFKSGPISEILAGIRMEPKNGGRSTELMVLGEAVPKNVLLAPLVQVVIQKSVQDVVRYCETFFEAVQKKSGDPFPRNESAIRLRLNRLHELRYRMAALPVNKGLLDSLLEHLSRGTDEEVIRMRPFALADRWGADRYEALKLFLYATTEGLVTLSWVLLCPNCQVVKAEYETLTKISKKFHCDVCRVAFNADFDESMELRFTVHPQVRDVIDNTYCIGGPANTPQIVAQIKVAGKGERDIIVPLQVGQYAYRLMGEAALGLLQVKHEEGHHAVRIILPNKLSTVGEAVVKAGEVSIRLQSERAEDIFFILESEKWRRQAATATMVTSFQEFRNLFSSEVLAPGEEIGIRNMAIIFSDLKDSTLLYNRIGDASAYSLVRAHFVFLLEAIAQNHGAVVKTIGDAVMAVFHKGVDAVRTCLEIQENLHTFNETQKNDRKIKIKIGAHQGPVIAVNANGNLDYFGTTVNVASRVQSESKGDDCLFTESLWMDKEVQTHVRERYGQLPVETFHASLKGFSEDFALVRVSALTQK